MKKLLISACAIALISYGLSESTGTQAANAQTGTLVLVANGEDFIRQGFISKDGWQIDFDHAYVTLSQVKAHSTEPAFDPSGATPLEPKQTVALIDQAKTIDLAEGEEDAKPIMVTQTDAPIGAYNALSWQVVPAQAGSAQGNSIVLAGTASKNEQKIDFVIGFEQELDYTCGEYVGEDRKGIVQAGNMAQVETTFHFDHIFGDNSLPTEDALNQESIGFEPLASLAQNGQLKVNQTDLEQKLDPESYTKLQQALSGLGHVGEGHCRS